MLRLLFALVLTTIAVTSVHAQQSNFTDANGRYAGSAFRHGNATTYTNSSGQFSGSAITRGKTTTFYDARGRYRGSATR